MTADSECSGVVGNGQCDETSDEEDDDESDDRGRSSAKSMTGASQCSCFPVFNIFKPKPK